MILVVWLVKDIADLSSCQSPVPQNILENHLNEDEKIKSLLEDQLLHDYAGNVASEPGWDPVDLYIGSGGLYRRVSLCMDLGLLNTIHDALGETVPTIVDDLILLAIECMPSLCKVARMSERGLN